MQQDAAAESAQSPSTRAAAAGPQAQTRKRCVVGSLTVLLAALLGAVLLPGAAERPADVAPAHSQRRHRSRPRPPEHGAEELSRLEAAPAGATPAPQRESAQELRAARGRPAATSCVRCDEGDLPRVSNRTGRGTCTGRVPPISSPYFCTSNVSDHARWRRDVREHQRTKRCSICGHALYEPLFAPTMEPHWFCSKIKNTVEPLPPEPRYRPEDVVVGLYSGEGIVYTRGSACADTWLPWFPHHHIYVSTDENAWGVKPTVPVRSLRDKIKFPEGSRMKWGPEWWNAQPLQLYGLQDMYRQHPDAEWYIISGDDTFLDPEWMLQMLSQYDSTQPLWVASSGYPETAGVPGYGPRKTQTLDVEKLKKLYPNWKTAPKFYWAPGSSSWWLSRPAAKMFADALDDFVVHVDTSAVCYCPDLLSGLLLSLLGLRVTGLNVKRRWGVHVYAVDAPEVDYSSLDAVVLYHYMWPRRMYGAAQRAQHAMLDRLQNTPNSQHRLWEFASTLLFQHREALARRRRQVRRLARKAKLKVEPFGGLAAPSWLPAEVPGSCVDLLHSMRTMIDQNYALLRPLQSQVVWLASKAKAPVNQNIHTGFDVPAWDPNVQDAAALPPPLPPPSDEEQNQASVLQTEVRWHADSVIPAPGEDGNAARKKCGKERRRIKSAVEGLRSKAAMAVFTLLPAAQRDGQGVVLVLGRPRNEALVRSLSQGRTVIALDGLESSKLLAAARKETPRGADVIIDALGDASVHVRMQQLMPLIRYQGLYLADGMEKCLTSAEGECAILLQRLVETLHRPHGSGRQDFDQCRPSGCDMRVESVHAWPGLLALRKGQVHPLWDLEASEWKRESLRDNGRPDNKVGERQPTVDEAIVNLQLGLWKSRELADERGDKCWSGRREFLLLCRKHHADKGDHHAYWRAYGSLMVPFRSAPRVRIIELGLSTGDSVAVWTDWFGHDAEIHSVDMTEEAFEHVRLRLPAPARDRVQLHAVNSPLQYPHPDFDWDGTVRASRIVRNAAGQRGFDIIADDAGHSPLQNMMFFHELFPHVRPGGLYVCEDLAAGAFLTPPQADRARLPPGLKDHSAPIALFVTATRAVLLGSQVSICGGCDEGLASVHWWDETVLLEKAVGAL
eukprot:TRINITY_DN55375_c0_g1_i1.p1 TRINITY_DN55375_c0_g1~~TRINITY_DN55375_c0_g1_i1.p1  ORF type:complete len:1124 (+),score=189.98 TRINITY_DN55375_c0_g1_i1:73-3444(+)